MCDPCRHHAPGETIEWHAAHMPSPTELAASNVVVDGVNAQALLEGCGGDVVIPCVLAGDSAHAAHTLCVHEAELVEEMFGEAPTL